MLENVQWEPRKGAASHQCTGFLRSHIWGLGFLQAEGEKISHAEDRQHNSGGLCQSNGGNKVVNSLTASKESLALMPYKRDTTDIPTPAWKEEYQGRLPLPVLEGLIRLGAGSRELCNRLGPTNVDLFATLFSTQLSRILETRPFGRGDRCIYAGLGRHYRVGIIGYTNRLGTRLPECCRKCKHRKQL